MNGYNGRLIKAIPMALLLGLSSCSPTVEYVNAPTDAPPTEESAAPPMVNDEWPRVFVSGGVTNIVYQPQVESWDGRTIVARNAVSVQSPAEPQPLFGIITVKATTLVNKTERLVDVQNVEILTADFPSAPDKSAGYLQMLRQEFPKQFLAVSLDRLESSLAANQAEQKAAGQPLNNTPPKIIVSDRPAILVLIDGEPAFRPVGNTTLQRVINTRVLLFKDTGTGQFYLHVLNGYLSAPSLDGQWHLAPVPPNADVAEAEARASRSVDLLEEQNSSATPAESTLSMANAPAIFVSTTPAELLTFNGQPDFVPIPGTQLLYAENTTGNAFKLLTDQQTYILVSGRWYRAPSLSGPWQFVPGEQLPADFAQVPDASPKENIKAGIPGTPQAREAVIENSIPQSAPVARTTQIQPPQVDGAPKLAPIEGTPLSYVVNSDTPIIEVSDQSWYACQNGVWYAGNSAAGPWTVAASVPPVIYSIPPSSPLYYVTFVRVYDANQDYVYDGYTPGYMGTVVAPDNVVVYGTGYYYSPWIGAVWYGAPCTWGLGCNLAWTPWWGWHCGFGFGWYWGGARWGWHPPAPWWGPYRSWPYRSWGRMNAWGAGGWAHTSVNLYTRNFGRAGATYHSYGVSQWHGVYGRSYNSRTGALTAGQQARVQNVFHTSAPAPASVHAPANYHANDVFATHEGNVYRYDSHASPGWHSMTPTPAHPSTSYPSYLERENSGRTMGQDRYNSFRSTYPSGGFHGGSPGGANFGHPGGNPGGGARGGGGRR